MMGYLHPDYVQSLNEFGVPYQLPYSMGWVLKRHIPGSDYQDAMGCYPIFSCRDWSLLHLDINELENRIVSLALVTDPFGNYNEEYLKHHFQKVFRFKEHFIVDLSKSRNAIVSKHHRYYAKKALKTVCVESCTQPEEYVNEWTLLYQNLIQRHNLTGLKAFSKRAFQKQLTIPGVVLHTATAEGELVAAHIWFIQNNVAYSHLAASSPLGYELMASYALYWFALDYFPHYVSYLDLGAGAGSVQRDNGGLNQFKRGWATGTKPTYFCGRIIDKRRYEKLVDVTQLHNTNYFPSYRYGEFS